MKNYVKLILLSLSTILVVSLFSGCAVSTAIEKRNLEVQTKMSDSIFLEPVEPSKQVVYVRVRNTTDKDIDIENEIKKAFVSNGFVVTKNPKKAEFMIQANLLQVGKSNANNARSALQSGFGGAVLGAGVAAASGASSARSYGTAGLVGALVGTVANSLIKDVYFTMITDVEIRQRAAKGEVIEQSSNGSSKQGMSASLNQTIKYANAQWKIYRTRIVSTANKVNLEFDEAKPVLTKGLTKSLSGVL
ncbi:complement resistance protein TraT [Arcobacter sp. YIC-464]|uniref:complement resistance protein TraT n=1 Tax=Arcobacter sp. YIC-464 TaxID=3376631 RepID=UPI003C169BCA